MRILPQGSTKTTWYDERIGGGRGDDAYVAADKTAVHAETPAVEHLDVLGRTFLTAQNNHYTDVNVLGGDGTSTVEEEGIETRVVLDIEGHARKVIDAHDRVIMRNDWDMAGRQMRSAGMDAGRRWLLKDVAGAPIRMFDERGHNFRKEYDCLRRPTASFVEGTHTEDSDERTLAGEVMFDKLEYGEGETDPEDSNLRGHVVRHFDTAGVVTTDLYDFKGNSVQSEREFAEDYKGIPDWSEDPDTETENFVTETTFDALDRPVETEKPDGSIIEIGYDRAGQFKTVEAYAVDDDGTEPTFAVTDVDYDAKGQRQRIEYGNGVETTYDYDPFTFRLVELRTERDDDALLQDLHYVYDPSGNITSIRDHAQQTHYFNNEVVEPHREYTYDSLYRVIEAKGREHEGQAGEATPTSWNDEHRTSLAHPHDGNAMRNYEKGFDYDIVGNLLETKHQAGSTSWKRLYEYESPSTLDSDDMDNRLTKTTVGSDDVVYDYDVHGNMTETAHLSKMEWGFQDQLFATAKQEVSNGDPETTYYVYDAGGQRVRKVTEREDLNGSGDPNRKNERIYVGDYEVYREYENDDQEPVETERKTLHVSDDHSRIALIETKTVDGSQNVSDPQPLVRHQLGDHLNSASLELDETGSIISYEEYYPYGSTSYQSVDGDTEVSAKRYRFTGKERDEDSGLYYHGARYYAPWQCRWTAPDPAGMVDGVNLYGYVRGNPVRLVDPDGMESEEGEEGEDESERTQPLDIPPYQDGERPRDAEEDTLIPTVTRTGDHITITFRIVYEGDVTSELREKWNTAIEEAWSGEFGPYTVEAEVREPWYSGGEPVYFRESRWNIVNVDEGWGRRPTVRNDVEGFWRPDTPASVVAHEVGHFLGLPDRRTEVTDHDGEPIIDEEGRVEYEEWPGWEGSIMETSEGVVLTEDIEDVLRTYGLQGPEDAYSLPDLQIGPPF